MFSVLVVPRILGSEDYHILASVESIYPSKLLLFEEKLDYLIKVIGKMLQDIERATSEYGPKKIKDWVLNYIWDSSEFPMESFQTMIEHIESKILNIQKAFSSQMKKSIEPPKKQAIGIEDQKQEVFYFIDYLYCLVDWGIRKKFEKIFDLKTLIVMKKLGSKAIYKIICLKSEKRTIQEHIENVFKRRAQFIGVEMLLTESNGPSEREEKLAKELSKQLIEKCLEILTISALLRGFVEVLNKYGLPPDFRYKIVETQYVKKEIRKLASSCKKGAVEDMIAIVDFP